MAFLRRDTEIIDSLLHFIKKLNDEAEGGAMVVVEGRKDAEALRDLGFKGSLFTACDGAGITALTQEALGFSKLILLFDLDAQGRALTGRTLKLLQGRLKMNSYFRKELLAITKGKIREIQGLSKFKDYVFSPGI